ncbi:MAG: SAM-dependent methyltransferase, partial [Planctomycetes bacterium]|nr:SAM-dependent methyltransferase [Planctomycetota bacterium]
PAGVATHGRPGYAHLLAFSRELRDDSEQATADVLPRLGTMTWPRAIGLEAAFAAVTWLRDHANARTIVDPFCGVGTALAVANRLGLHAIGVEINPGRAERARTLVVRS